MAKTTDLSHGFNYIDPANQDYIHYFDHLLAFNKGIHRKVAEGINTFATGRLSQDSPLFATAIATTGSDARLEKGPVSLVEFVIFGKSFYDLEFAARDLRRYALRNGLINVYDPDIELKNVVSELMSHLTVNRGKPHESRLVSPNRVFDATLFFGDSTILAKAQEQMVAELKAPEGKNILDTIRDRCRQHRKITLYGVQRFKRENLVHYDFEGGTAFYDPPKNKWAFKQGPLRALQYALVRDAVSRLRAGGDARPLFTLPKNTIEKLNALSVEHLTALSQMQIADLADNYKYFLWLYHKSQEVHKRNGAVELGFEARETFKRCQDLTTLCNQAIIKPN